MRIKQRKAFAVSSVLAREIRKRGGFPDSHFPNDVDMRPAVGRLDAELLPVIAEILLGKDSDAIVGLGCLHKISLATDWQSERRAKSPLDGKTETKTALNPPEQFRHGDLESAGYFFYVDQRNIPLAAFDAAHVSAVEAAEICEFFLRNAHLFASLSDRPTKSAAYVFHGPRPLMLRVCSPCVHTR
jgi:hypothetical protein